MYDPRHGVLYAWRTLAAQWMRAYRFAGINRDSGHLPMGSMELWKLICESRLKHAITRRKP